MKQITLFSAALFLLFVAPSTRAQNHLGFVGGVNLADMDVDETGNVDLKNRTGLGAGGVLEIGLGSNLALRLEPMYLQKGVKAEETDPQSGTVEITFKLDYIEVPLFFKLGLGSGTGVRPYLLAGPTVGFNTSAKAEVSAGGFSVSGDIGELFKSVDFGAGFGAGFDFPFGNNSFFIEGRYALGLANILEEGDVNLGGEQVAVQGEAKTKGIQIMAGVSFPLGR